MHDALLFEHQLAETPGKVVAAFENIMTEVLGGRVAGKASIGDFVERDSSSSSAAPQENEV